MLMLSNLRQLMFLFVVGTHAPFLSYEPNAQERQLPLRSTQTQ